ncbi:zinc-binding dehydrogenase [Terrilactibacillus sp. BCM23-1]|uniref:Zinc-binding dehydrogenase n=1 Tax=Terrilactibacillus tamarindi TaxID=2599694 RepID=A0A6N8CSV3_9BACI|nr:zinc-binding dehydrogenase [Terrilactibacillus tamarindi]MTT33259.1 zinc-binding dehydrogenase [Terrilactibacillus tamarindi]
MKAIIHEGTPGIDGLHKKEDFPEQSVGQGEVKIRLKVAGMNHRDLFVLQRHKENEPALIIGSDGSGVISEVGEGVTRYKVGDEVIIIPSLRWRTKSVAPPDDFDILGLPDHGTFAETIVLKEEQVALKPDYLSFEEAGILALSGLTGYRALFTQGQLTSGQTVFIPGIGGGVATLMLQMAKSVGAKVIVSSRSEEKRKKALELGATLAIGNDEDWSKVLKNTKVDLVIESVGAATWNRSLKVLKKGGTIVAFGSSTGDIVEMNLREFFYGQYRFFGSTMGSIEEFHEMLKLFSNYQIKPIVDRIFDIDDYEKAFDWLEKGQQFGKIALKINE